MSRLPGRLHFGEWAGDPHLACTQVWLIGSSPIFSTCINIEKQNQELNLALIAILGASEIGILVFVLTRNV
jgi:hypothetical protein